MMRQIDLGRLLDDDNLVPQAVLSAPMAHLKRLGYKVVKGHDDFDSFKGVALDLDGISFAALHYAGHPKGTMTIYLPRQLEGVDEITAIVFRVARALELPREAIYWHRAQSPDL